MSWVVCVLSFLFVIDLYYLCVYICSCIGIFLVNGILSHILFNSGATRSFVSLALSKKFRHASWTLESLLEVEIADDRTVSVARVYLMGFIYYNTPMVQIQP